MPTTTFSGLRKSVRLINYASKTEALIVLFTATGVSAFFKYPLYELFEQNVLLNNFFSQSKISCVEERLTETNCNKKKIAIIEQLLYSKLINNKLDELVSEAITKIHLCKGLLTIKELANCLFISYDTLEKRLRKATGATPKQFASSAKMENLFNKKRDANRQTFM